MIGRPCRQTALLSVLDTHRTRRRGRSSQLVGVVVTPKWAIPRVAMETSIGEGRRNGDKGDVSRHQTALGGLPHRYEGSAAAGMPTQATPFRAGLCR